WRHPSPATIRWQVCGCKRLARQTSPQVRHEPAGDEPMTGAQKSYLSTLSEEAGEEMDENLSKAEAAKKIDELQLSYQAAKTIGFRARPK
ncbi:Protein of unknown function, partial [Nitrosospira multiformis]